MEAVGLKILLFIAAVNLFAAGWFWHGVLMVGLICFYKIK